MITDPHSIQTCGALAPDLQAEASKFLTTLSTHGRNLPLKIEINPENPSAALEEVVRAIAKKTSGSAISGGGRLSEDPRIQQLPKTISFPYSRHSSYSELCEFVNAWKPKDIWPCTVDEEEWLRECKLSSDYHQTKLT